MDGRDVQLHRLGLAGRRPGSQLDAARMRLQGILHAQRHGRDDGLPVGRGMGQRIGSARIDHQVHVPLPVQRHLARAVPRHGAKTQPLQHLAQGLGLAGRVLDELYAVDPEAIGRLGHVFPAAGGGIGHCGTPDGNMIVVPRTSGIALLRSNTRKTGAAQLRDTEEGPPRTEGVVPLSGGRREAAQGVSCFSRSCRT
ncbi:hypothetical protein A4U96_15405 [Staphylococcus aureus]|nr:hypothetical protein A4U96_15405 [Staphylococcus aureus]